MIINAVHDPNELSVHFFYGGFTLYFYLKNTSTPAREVVFVKEKQHENDYDEICMSKFRETVQAKGQLHERFTKVRLIFSNSYFSLIPYDFHKDTVNPLQLVDSVPNNYVQAKATVSNNMMQLDYAYNPKFITLINQLFPQAQVSFDHSCKQFIERLLPLSEIGKIYVWLNVKSIEIVGFANHKVVFYNYFTTSTPEDIAYYVLAVIRQLNARAVQVIGHVEENESTVHLLRELIDSLQLGVSNTVTFREFLL